MANGRAMTVWQRWSTAQQLLVVVPATFILLVVRQLAGERWALMSLAVLGVAAVAVVIRGPEWARMFVLSVGAAVAAAGLVILGIAALG